MGFSAHGLTAPDGGQTGHLPAVQSASIGVSRLFPEQSSETAPFYQTASALSNAGPSTPGRFHQFFGLERGVPALETSEVFPDSHEFRIAVPGDDDFRIIQGTAVAIGVIGSMIS
jgi:hypothetical protein